MPKSRIHTFAMFIFGIVGLSFLLGGLIGIISTRNSIKNYIPAQGTIYESQYSQETDRTILKVTFTAIQQGNIDFTDQVFNRQLDEFAQGVRVAVLYNPNNPQEARIDSYRVLYASYVNSTLIGIVFLVAGPFFILKDVKKRKIQTNLSLVSMKQVKIYTTTYCPYCVRAKDLLTSLNIPFEEINVEDNHELREQLIEKYEWRTVPMIFIGEQFIGGSDDLYRLHAEGKLLPLLNQ